MAACGPGDASGVAGPDDHTAGAVFELRAAEVIALRRRNATE